MSDENESLDIPDDIDVPDLIISNESAKYVPLKNELDEE